MAAGSGRCKPLMIGICRHALASPGALRSWRNGLYCGLTCPLCLPEGGVHVALAARSREAREGHELWQYLLARLLLTPEGRALHPDAQRRFPQQTQGVGR